MKYIILADSTRINGCADTTSPYEIYIPRSTYTKAGEEADKFTKENVVNVKVYDSDTDELVSNAVNLIFSQLTINRDDDSIVVRVTTRNKTELEVMHDEISELQEVVLEGM